MAERKKDNGSLKPKLKRKEYEEELKRLQGELCQLQEWVKHNGLIVATTAQSGRVTRAFVGGAFTRP